MKAKIKTAAIIAANLIAAQALFALPYFIGEAFGETASLFAFVAVANIFVVWAFIMAIKALNWLKAFCRPKRNDF